jgi:hypothetical protein
LCYLEINSKSFSGRSYEQLRSLIPDLPDTQAKDWLEEIIERLPDVLEAERLAPEEAGPPGNEASHKLKVIEPQGAVRYRERLAALYDLCNEVRVFLSRLRLNPYEALARSGQPPPPGLTDCQKDCFLARIPTERNRPNRFGDSCGFSSQVLGLRRTSSGSLIN